MYFVEIIIQTVLIVCYKIEPNHVERIKRQCSKPHTYFEHSIHRFHLYYPIRSEILHFLPVLIAPLFAIFVLREALSVDGGNTRKGKKKKRKKGKRRKAKEEEKSIHNHLQSVHPRHFNSGERTSPPFQWRVAPFYWHACWLTLSLSLSFFRVLPPLFTTLIVLRVWLQTSRALSLAKNAISAMTFHQGTNIVRSTYLFNYWLERYLSFFPFVISMLAKCINSNFLRLQFAQFNNEGNYE